MVLPTEPDELAEKRFEELCQDLNLDSTAKEEAWESYEKTKELFTLEGDVVQWLACAVYTSCRMSKVPAVNSENVIEGNCVSLARLLKLSGMSLVQFFSKMKKWADMCCLAIDFRDNINRLERKFDICSVLFQKYGPIFTDVFNDPAKDPPKVSRNRKQRRNPCSVSDVFRLCWTLFVQVKGHFSWMSEELVSCYHLLLCCVDWFYKQALLSCRRDLLNSSFKCLPDNYHDTDFKPFNLEPCIMKHLCENHNGLVVDAKTTKEHYWKPYIEKLMKEGVLKGVFENKSAILEIGNYEINCKTINNLYDEQILNDGSFDERVFLGSDAHIDIGTPQKQFTFAMAENSETASSLKPKTLPFGSKTFAPSTPLTGRAYLKDKEGQFTPVSSATQGITCLQKLLAKRKATPSEKLMSLFTKCDPNPKDCILERVIDMGKLFCSSYSDHGHAVSVDFVKRRLQYAEKLYFKCLEDIMIQEINRHSAKNKVIDLTHMLEQDVFHKSLYVCCIEIILFSFDAQKKFPWVLQVFKLSAYNFYKVIEVLIRAEDGLSRDVIKHLNRIEESILESYAWQYESPLWDVVQQIGNVYACEDVTLPNQIESESNRSQQPTLPPLRPSVTSIIEAERGGHQLNRNDMLSPISSNFLGDRYSSTPMRESVKRTLFSDTKTQKATDTTKSADSSQKVPGCETTQVRVIPEGSNNLDEAQIITCRKTATNNGTEVLQPVRISSTVKAPDTKAITAEKPRKTGSLALFVRKFYYLASVRLRYLCEHLDIDRDLLQKTWTCFEWCIIRHATLMKDRHLDQILMSALYLMAKLGSRQLTFARIMKCYRMQPQAESHVYRSVLLKDKRHIRRHSGSSDDSSPEQKGGSRSVPFYIESVKAERPATPTTATGVAKQVGEQVRGDVVKFYNDIFCKEIEDWTSKFRRENPQDVPLSPLPLPRMRPSSPRRVSNNHCLFVSPQKQRHTIKPVPSTNESSTRDTIMYCIAKSPAKDLRAINTIVGHNNTGAKSSMKRLHDEISDKPPEMSYKMSRLQALQLDRQRANSKS